MRILSLFLILSALLIAQVKACELENIFKLYSNKDTALCFKQTVINSMSGQSIVKNGRLTIKDKKYMVFDYKNERVVIDNFEAVDYLNGKKTIYKLNGFNKILYLMFLGKKKFNELFFVKKKKNLYILEPKYQSNVDSVELAFCKNSIDNLTIIDIYSNKTIYNFNDSYCKRTSKGD